MVDNVLNIFGGPVAEPESEQADSIETVLRKVAQSNATGFVVIAFGNAQFDVVPSAGLTWPETAIICSQAVDLCSEIATNELTGWSESEADENE